MKKMKYDYYFLKLEAFWQKRKRWIIGFGILLLLVGLSQYGRRRSVKLDPFRARIESHLSKFDGSHDKLEAYIKAGMNNPGSYRHVSTSYLVPADTTATSVIFTTSFRGENAFGATVIQTVQAQCNIYTGEVEQVISQ